MVCQSYQNTGSCVLDFSKCWGRRFSLATLEIGLTSHNISLATLEVGLTSHNISLATLEVGLTSHNISLVTL